MTSYFIYQYWSWIIIFLLTFATSLATKSNQKIYFNKRNISSIVCYEKTTTNIPMEKIKKEFDELSEIERNIHYVRTSKVLGGPDKSIKYFHIDVVAIADYSLFVFLNQTLSLQNQNKSMIKPFIREEIAHLFFGAKRVYLQNKFSIPGMFDFKIVLNLVDIIIFETKEESFLTDMEEEIDAYKALELLRKFARQVGEKQTFDHMTLITANDLVLTTSGELDHNIVAIAYTSRMCVGPWSVSIIEGLMEGKSVLHLVHEIGHALGADHDGESNNNCRPEDQYLMSAVFDLRSKTLNHWKFSECSRKEIASNILRLYNGGIKDFLNKDATDASFKEASKYMCDCYTKNIPIQKLVPDVSRRFRGSEMEYSRQCAFSGYLDVEGRCDISLPSRKSCLIRYCLKKQIGKEYCMPIIPFRGTSCEAGRVCEDGYCRSIEELKKVKTDFSPNLTAPASNLESFSTQPVKVITASSDATDLEEEEEEEPQKSSYCLHDYGLNLVILTLLVCGTLTE